MSDFNVRNCSESRTANENKDGAEVAHQASLLSWFLVGNGEEGKRNGANTQRDGLSRSMWASTCTRLLTTRRSRKRPRMLLFQGTKASALAIIRRKDGLLTLWSSMHIKAHREAM